MKKTIAVLLILAMFLLPLISCASENGKQDDTTETLTDTTEEETTTGAEEDPPKTARLEIVVNHSTEYQIVYPSDGLGYEEKMANKLCNVITDLTGVTLPVVVDSDKDKVWEKEILVGITNRLGFQFYSNGYKIMIDEERVLILADSEVGLYYGIARFIDDMLGVNIITTSTEGKLGKSNLFCKRNYMVSRSDFASEISILNYEIYRDVNDFFMNRMAYQLYDTFLQNGISVNLSESETPGLDDSGNPVSRFLVKQDDTLEKGTWKVAAAGNDIEISASTYYGFLGAFRAMVNWEALDYAGVQQGATKTGGFVDALNDKEASDRYVYDRQGEYRVMFYNVLFGQYTDNGDVPTADRNRLEADMFAQYMPDVIACQEFNSSKRQNTKDIYGAFCPEYALPGLMAEYGYVETVDPAVRNAGPFNETFVHTSPVLGDITYYTFGGGDLITPEEGQGDPYYTYYNNTPLFYNTNTTKYIDGEYYWYQSHWDGKEWQATDNPDPVGGAGDWGSKSATWGLFESIETGERYVVISTHMCTRSNYIRALEAIELIDLVLAIEKKYEDVPILLGGDLNGNSGGYNVQLLRGNMTDTTVEKLTKMTDEIVTYKHSGTEYSLTPYKNYSKLAEYTKKVAFNDLQVSGDAKVFSSEVCTAHGYPAYNRDLRMMRPGSGENTHFDTDCIDHIMTANDETLEPMVFGVVVDDRSLSGSDHLPIFLDFNINPKAPE